ncbi:adenosylcobinamide kinase [Paludibacter propionicigenes WB4]|uniref:Adenosylcobinamide kinase n=1 Tax=Paludibacter propionicigenes (strain DSM 17365 / JCM 13257 / WB4) TaxID=694427 RepID=E4T2K4_PALPW|nr:bifunctional adenosylcobinamide kinase/adenosylcobinamide-phosphate guanylyltransferase [Paludibacter propionicigenes]ADQ78948.1 adenosylcobinamide kinase [Paludibacter propionicigenes WB4]
MGTKRIILITGGQRSGKSSYAQKLALSLTDNPVYLATSAVWDEEHRQRIERHKRDRGPEWTNIEEQKDLQNIDVTGRVVVIDCVTLWSTNFFSETDGDVDVSLAAVTERFEAFTQQNATFIFVTNELGLGGTSTNDLQRRFNDLLGWVNQHIAAASDEMVLMVSGIPVYIK